VSQSSESCVAVSSICTAQFGSTYSSRADNNSRKLLLPVSLVCPRPIRHRERNTFMRPKTAVFHKELFTERMNVQGSEKFTTEHVTEREPG
jgi:hypothetical protein